MDDELILVDGATGFIGSNLVEYLRKKGYNVRASGRNIEKLNALKKFGAEVIRCDLLDKEQIPKMLEGVDKIVHCTGCINMGASWDEMYKGNVQTAENMYEAALNYDIKKIIHFSSTSVYGKQTHEVIKEGDPKNAKDNYGKTKWLGEQTGMKLSKENGFPITALRPTLIYGPGDAGFGYCIGIGVVLNSEFRKKRLIISWKKKVQLVNIENVVEAVSFLLDSGANSNGEAYNIADPTIVPFSEIWGYYADFLPYPETKRGIINPILNSNFLLLVLSKLSNTNMAKRFFDRMIDKRLDQIRKEYTLASPTPMLSAVIGNITGYIGKHDIIYDLSKITDLGYNPVCETTEEGIKDTIRWYMDNKWMPNYGKVN